MIEVVGKHTVRIHLDAKEMQPERAHCFDGGREGVFFSHDIVARITEEAEGDVETGGRACSKADIPV